MFLRNCTLFVHMEEIQKREISRKLSNIETSQWEAVESSPLLNGRNNLNENWMESMSFKAMLFSLLQKLSQQFLRSYWYLLSTV